MNTDEHRFRAGRILICVYLCSSVVTTSFAGSLTTLDGRVIGGDVTLETGSVVIATPKNGAPSVRADIQDVLIATFGPGDAVPPADELLTRGVVMSDGTALAADRFERVDDRTVRFTRSEGRDPKTAAQSAAPSVEVTVDTRDVARIVFDALSGQLLSRIPSARSGVLLASGDFVEGEFESADSGRVKITSVLFGRQSFEIGRQALAVVLRERKGQPGTGAAARYVVRLTDGSTLEAKSVAMNERGVVAITTLTFGPLQVLPNQLLEIRAAGESLVPLASLTATPQAAVDITMPAGSLLTVELDGKYASLVARVGVPTALVPSRRVRFIALVDGKERFRSNELTSVDDPVSIAISLRDARTLTLRVESPPGHELGAAGLWTNPTLVGLRATTSPGGPSTTRG
jgi:hypothetical protein